MYLPILWFHGLLLSASMQQLCSHIFQEIWLIDWLIKTCCNNFERFHLESLPSTGCLKVCSDTKSYEASEFDVIMLSCMLLFWNDTRNPVWLVAMDCTHRWWNHRWQSHDMKCWRGTFSMHEQFHRLGTRTRNALWRTTWSLVWQTPSDKYVRLSVSCFWSLFALGWVTERASSL